MNVECRSWIFVQDVDAFISEKVKVLVLVKSVNDHCALSEFSQNAAQNTLALLRVHAFVVLVQGFFDVLWHFALSKESFHCLSKHAI